MVSSQYVSNPRFSSSMITVVVSRSFLVRFTDDSSKVSHLSCYDDCESSKGLWFYED